MNLFSALLPAAALASRPTGRGRAVPEREPHPVYPRFVRLAVGTKERPRAADAPGRNARRAAASPRVRALPLTPAGRAVAARFRARLAVVACTAREAAR